MHYSRTLWDDVCGGLNPKRNGWNTREWMHRVLIERISNPVRSSTKVLLPAIAHRYPRPKMYHVPHALGPCKSVTILPTF